ncbi:hypothetical protein KFE25_009174 [Diacronema lutheri]|uniref:F-box domain-containing protein n=1 Tax=Diacronema lutheri TaxID=2081491 RepID=A0A8J6CK71_DIALT|nr:hypothetical protein KFE25_009174 [Diacronema lutheri]
MPTRHAARLGRSPRRGLELLDLGDDILQRVLAAHTLAELVRVERVCTAFRRACWALGAADAPLLGLSPKEVLVRTRVLVCFADVRGDRGAVDVLAKLSSADPSLVVRLHDMLARGVPGAELDSFDAVLVFHNALDLWPHEAMGDRLAAFVDLGRGVVTALFSSVDNTAELTPHWPYALVDSAGDLALGGRWRREGYSPVVPGRQDERVGLAHAVTLGHAPVADHPVLRGVRSLSAGREAYLCTGPLSVSSRAQPIAFWRVFTALTDSEEPEASDSLVLAAETERCAHGERMVVALNLYPPSSDAHFALWDASTDGARLMANALRYVAPRTRPDRRPCDSDGARDARAPAIAALAGCAHERAQARRQGSWRLLRHSAH